MGSLFQLQGLHHEKGSGLLVLAATAVAVAAAAGGGGGVVGLGVGPVAVLSRQLRLSESHLTLLVCGGRGRRTVVRP
jgi:hypothetical protein